VKWAYLLMLVSVPEGPSAKSSAEIESFRLYLDRRRSKSVIAPRRVTSYKQFDSVMMNVAKCLTGVDVADRDRFLESMYYLLGWCVGDFGKDYGNERRLSSRIAIQLTKNHPENLDLGEHVAECVRMIGIWCKRYGDRPALKSNPNGSFFWKSTFSPIVGWLSVAALGMNWDERTTSHPVRMDWMLYAPAKFRLWFLRRVADSDGHVNVRNKIIEITSSPNTYFFDRLFKSLSIKSSVRFSRGYGYVAITATEAARIRPFSPDVLTYRRRMVEKFMGARTFQGP
jgi:hypothetical protein